MQRFEATLHLLMLQWTYNLRWRLEMRSLPQLAMPRSLTPAEKSDGLIHVLVSTLNCLVKCCVRMQWIHELLLLLPLLQERCVNFCVSVCLSVCFCVHPLELPCDTERLRRDAIMSTLDRIICPGLQSQRSP